jgi:hypothetical protein
LKPWYPAALSATMVEADLDGLPEPEAADDILVAPSSRAAWSRLLVPARVYRRVDLGIGDLGKGKVGEREIGRRALHKSQARS